jgi:chromate transport protein ChrA
MGEPDKTPPPRRTIAVTIAGVLLLLPAAASALMAFVFAPGSHLSNAYASGVGLVAAAIFGCAGLATIRRWRGWRIWAGVAAWGMIVIFVLQLLSATFAEIPSFIMLALAIFVLIAKRRERRPDFTAIFR